MKLNLQKINKSICLLILCTVFIFTFSCKASVSDISQDQKGLKGIVICIDAGHQKKGNMKTEPVAPGSKEMKEKTSSGTSGIVTTIPEYKLNLEVALMLQKELQSLGAKVVMTRTNNDVDLSNIERANIANKSKSDLCIRIHADSSADSRVNGISMLIPGDKYIKNKDLLSKSKKAGQQILNSVISSTKAKSRGMIIRNDLTGFNWSKVPVVLIEMGFMSNSAEDKKLSKNEYRQQIAKGIANGVMKYFEQH